MTGSGNFSKHWISLFYLCFSSQWHPHCPSLQARFIPYGGISLLQLLAIHSLLSSKKTDQLAFTASVQLSCSVVSDSLWFHGLKHARLPCPSPTSRTCSNSFPSSRWCHPTISSSVVTFSSCLQSFPAWGSFPMSSKLWCKKKIIEKFSDHPDLVHGPNSRSVKCGLWERVR